MDNSGNQVIEFIKVAREYPILAVAALFVFALIIYIPYRWCTRKKGGDR